MANRQQLKTSLKTSSPRHFLDIDKVDAKTLRRIIDNAHTLKRAGRTPPPKLKPQDIETTILGMIFEKPSTRTRVSFDVAMRQLGGQTMSLNQSDLQLGRGETIADTARVLSRYVDAIMIRSNAHATLLELAQHATVPVINGLTDKSHPCQVMADIMTFEEAKGPIEGSTIAWLGDGNNVLTSMIHAAVRFGFTLRIACPEEFMPDADVIAWAKREKGDVAVGHDPVKAARGADCIVTDTWVSMGQSDADKRKRIFKPYAVGKETMAVAAKDAIFMHCLPAYRGQEVAADVIDGPQSVVFDEAENRVHAQKAILAWCFGAS